MNTIRSWRSKSLLAIWRSLIVLVMISSMLLAEVKTVDAAETSRTARVESVTGTVQVKKAGGTKEYKAFKNMSLNHGDLIKTSAKSSIVLSIADKEDEITVGENTEVYISELQQAASNKQTDLKVWSGSVFIKAKPLTQKEDQFSISTPTAVMGVRGTQFLVTVDPNTGKSTIVVAAGVVAAHNPNQNQMLNLYPAMQGSFFQGRPIESVPLPTSASAVIQPGDLMNTLSPEIIQALIRSKLAMDLEHDEFIAKQLEALQQGQLTDPLTQLQLTSPEDLERYQQNLHALVNSILRVAIDNGKVTPDQVEQLIKDTNLELQRKIQLDGKPSLDWSTQQELERQKRLELEEQRRQLAEQEKKQREAELAKNLTGDLLNKIKEQQDKLAKANEEAKNKAREQAEKNLPVNPSAPGTPGGSGSSPGSGSGGGGSSGGGGGGGSGGGGGGKDPDDSGTIVSIPNITTETLLNNSYTLPQIIQAKMSNGKERNVAVRWNKPVDTSLTGTFTYYGSVSGYQPKVEATLKVVAPFGVPVSLNQQRMIFQGNTILDFGSMTLPPNATVMLENLSPSLPADSGLSVAGPIIDFHFSGIEITQPVMISFPVNTGAHPEQLAIFHKNSDLDWEYVPTVVSNGTATAQVSHFSAYGVLSAAKVGGVTSSPVPGLVDAGTSIYLISETPGATIYVKQNDGFVEYEPGDAITIPSAGSLEAYATKSNMRDGEPVQLSYSTAQANVIDSKRISVTFSQPIQTEAYAIGVSPAGSTALSGLPIEHVERVGDSGLTITLETDTVSIPLQSFSVKFYNGSQYVAQTNSFELGTKPKPPEPKPPQIKTFPLTLSELGTDMANLEWSIPEGTVDYKVYLNGELRSDFYVESNWDAKTSYLYLYDLAPETKYSVKIEALNNSGKKIAEGSRTFTTNSFAGIQVEVTDRGADFLTIKWSRSFEPYPNGDHYRLYIGEGGAKEYKASVTANSPLEYSFTGLLPSKSYTLYVEAWPGGWDNPRDGGKTTASTLGNTEATSFTINTQELATDSASFFWNKPAGTEGYEVYVNDEQVLNPSIEAPPDGMSFLYLHDLAPATNYSLRVYALDASHKRIGQGFLTFKTQPLPPEITISVGESGPDSIMISWESNIEPGQYNGEYRVYLREGDNKVLEKTVSFDSFDRTHVFLNLNSGTEYTFYVEAWKRSPDTLIVSTEGSGSTTDSEPEVEDLLIEQSDISTNSATFKWSKITDTASYRVYRNSSLLSESAYTIENGADQVLSMSGLEPDTPYTLMVEALNSFLQPIARGVREFRTDSEAPPAIELRAFPEATSIRVTWNPVAFEGEYHLYLDDNKTDVRTVASGESDPSYIFEGLETNKEYTIYIEAWPTDAASPFISGQTTAIPTPRI
ncbi:fibronectin type III domain-containing protein [uncultured Brevibacillus sp.]|uniref:fibronectin type III domain-containing protein n=1 Tax=uncultured Brevibacillus sp. TaxID=169970 RepID=UPI002591D34E|nr:fibronectin type III domain-containing protein [uncultured Brevibacillus sp.]